MTARLPRVPVAELTPRQRELYHTIADGPRREHATYFPVVGEDGNLSGPYRAMLLSPGVGAALERVGVAIRYESDLPPAVRELAILMVARHCRCPVEWQAHEALARASGVPAVTIETLAAETTPRETSDSETSDSETSAGAVPTLVGRDAETTYAFVRALLVDNRVSDETFENAVSLLTLPGVFELIATVGYYQIIAGVNNAFGLAAEAK